MPLPNLPRESYTVGIICALAVEKAAVEATLDEEHGGVGKTTGDENSYNFGRIGEHNVVVASLPAGVTGKVPAAVAARDMMRSFPIKAGFMVGIGGGVWSEKADVRLGDVVVSQPDGMHGGVVQWDSGKMEREGVFRRTGTLNKPPRPLLNAVQSLKARHMRCDSEVEKHLKEMWRKYPRVAKQFQRPGRLDDSLFTATYAHDSGIACDGCDPSQTVRRAERDDDAPQIHYGNIASGDEVMKDGPTRDRIAQEEGILCFEMEAAGLMDSFPCVVIRGICDYADSHKNKQWQPYAAATAACYCKELLGVVDRQGIVELELASKREACQIDNLRNFNNDQSGPLSLTLDLDQALSLGRHPEISNLLDQHLDAVATGSWKWLPELFELGFDASGVARLLIEQQTQKPWVQFESWAEKGRLPRSDGHVQECVHGIGDIPKCKDSQADLRDTLASLCGIAGVVPIAGEKSGWNGHIDFNGDHCASVSFRVVEDGQTDVSDLLLRITNALDGFCSAAAEFQSYGGCCDRYSYLCPTNPSHLDVDDALRLVVMPFDLSAKFLEGLKQASLDLDNALPLRTCSAYARTILENVVPGPHTEQSDVVSQRTHLHYCALAVQFLCLSFMSYCQAHVGTLRFFFLDHQVRSAHLTGATEGPLTILDRTIDVGLERLTCLDTMLNDSVIVFRPSSRLSDGNIQPRPGRRYDVLATLENLIDTWGPAGLVSSQGNPRDKTFSGILIRGGIIQGATKQLWHWSSDSDQQGPGTHVASMTELLRFGALITKNPDCSLDEMHCLSTSDGFRDDLGSYSPFWLEKQRQAGISAGQYVTIQYIDVMEKDPGRTLKKNKVENLYRILNCSSSDQLLPFLESPWGIQVSFCSGLARRVEMRELLADLLPTWMQRKVPPPEKWLILRDIYAILEVLRRGDLNNWIIRLLNHDRRCYDFLCDEIVNITNHLVPTGVDKSGRHFVVAWISSQRDMDSQCFKVPITKDNFWTRTLQDSSDCATFAFVGKDVVTYVNHVHSKFVLWRPKCTGTLMDLGLDKWWYLKFNGVCNINKFMT
ncbi:hypothetical protein LTR49_027659 [Elasticomyces elasticus]|nr:hypothetical protein LTR49_027659 [Elasticomyces elasticus]